MISDLSDRDIPDEPVWSVIRDGRHTTMTQSQIDRAKRSGEFDLVLDLTTQKLTGRFYRSGVQSPELTEVHLNYKATRVIYAGMYRLRPFGDLHMARINPNEAELSRRDLASYVCEATRVIQQGRGTQGPYLFAANNQYAVSSTGYAYFLSRDYHYLAIEYQL